MRILKVKAFARWAWKEGISDRALCRAASEIRNGLVDARLGSGIVKKRVPAKSRGKRGGGRTIVAFCEGKDLYFMYGFLKNEKENLDEVELRALRHYAKALLMLSKDQISALLQLGELFEVSQHGK